MKVNAVVRGVSCGCGAARCVALVTVRRMPGLPGSSQLRSNVCAFRGALRALHAEREGGGAIFAFVRLA
eukprot:14651849-Alexandrium_andersonii.AAC.1